MSAPAQGKTTKPIWERPWLVAAWLLLGYLVWKADVIWNYVQFRQLCAEEGGLRVYEKLQKNVGWEQVTPRGFQAKASEQEARWYLSRMPNINFFRVPKANDFPPPLIPVGTLVDVRYLGAPALPSTSYSFHPADLSVQVIYQYDHDVDIRQKRGDRNARFWFEVREKETQKVMLRYTQFSFHWRTIPVWHWFGPTGTTGCPIPEGRGIGSVDINRINETAFKD